MKTKKNVQKKKILKLSCVVCLLVPHKNKNIVYELIYIYLNCTTTTHLFLIILLY